MRHRFRNPTLALLAGIAMQYQLVMAIDYKNTTANFALDQLFDTKFPAGSFVRVRTGAPAGAENAAGGSLLASIVLPATPWAAAASGSKAKQGSWTVAAAAAGTAGHYRLENAAATELEEGTATITGGGGDMILDNTNIAIGQNVTVTTLTRSL